MQCERLIKLAKQWYLHVKDETMAPARMVQFIKQHVASCPICAEDPDIDAEIDRVTDIILPDSKIPKAVRMKQEAEEAERNSDSEDLEDDEESDDSDDSDDSEDKGEDDTDEDPLDSDD
jgi:hypothetical protein